LARWSAGRRSPHLAFFVSLCLCGSPYVWRRIMRRASAFTIALLLSSTLAAQDKAPPSGPASRGIVLSPEEEYRIGPSDVVEVYILRVPELSREYRVSADGSIEIPFLGKVRAQKKTSQELAIAIADGLREGYLV